MDRRWHGERIAAPRGRGRNNDAGRLAAVDGETWSRFQWMNQIDIPRLIRWQTRRCRVQIGIESPFNRLVRVQSKNGSSESEPQLNTDVRGSEKISMISSNA